MQADEAERLIDEAIARCERGGGGTPPNQEPLPDYPGLDGIDNSPMIGMPPGEEGPQ